LASYAFPSPIVPANWINGGANLKFKVSGILSYNSDPNAPIPLVGFTVLLKTNPGNITVGTTTTNASGYYEFSIANGNYIIESAAPSGTIWSADLDDVIAMFDYVGGVPLPDSNPLRLIAGDVNQNGDIDLDDVIDVFYKVGGETLPDYTAPEWVFGNLTLTVNCADLPNQNLMGLNSGNVLGSNPTPNP
ncbi:MAG: SdrD B-like domain-containing protein, partial [bacterium]